ARDPVLQGADRRRGPRSVIGYRVYSAKTDIGPPSIMGAGAGSAGPSPYASQAQAFCPGVAPRKCTVALLVSPVSTPSHYVPGASVTGAASGSPIHSPPAAAVTIRSGPVAASAPGRAPASR